MLKMSGILFSTFPPDERSPFVMDDGKILVRLPRVKKETGADASALLCTCDRVELWEEVTGVDLYEPLCRSLGISILKWKDCAYGKEGKDAVDHLFSLSSGLLSPLYGEDTIISQIAHASTLSREAGCASASLQQLFRLAVTAGKKVQATVDMDGWDQDLYVALRPCLVDGAVLVLGSSQTARHVASSLVSEGRDVTMTLRDERKTELIPVGVKEAAWDDRYGILPSFPNVVSATKGLGYSLDDDAPVRGDQCVVDLANPWDVSERLRGKCHLVREAELEYPRLVRKRTEGQCLAILKEKEQSFYAWLSREKRQDDVTILAERIAQDMVYRIQGSLEKLAITKEQMQALSLSLSDSAFKSVVHGLYGNKPSSYQDLTMPFVSGKALVEGDPPTLVEPWLTLEKDGCEVSRISMGSHSFTHIDAPSHMVEGGSTLDSFPITRFFGKGYVMDLAIPDLASFPSGCDMVLFHSGGRFLDVALAKELLKKGVRLFGFDAPSPDEAPYPIHRLLFAEDILIVENLVNLEGIMGLSVHLSVLPLPVFHGNGAPCRAVAMW